MHRLSDLVLFGPTRTQAVGGGFPEPSGKEPGDRSGDPGPPLVNDGRGPPILVSRTEAVA
jgi:hypothetical protein